MSFVLSSAEVPHDEFVSLLRLLSNITWEVAANRPYHDADVTDQFTYKRAFLIKLPPHTAMHKHVDCGDCRTDHIVLQTNEKAINHWDYGSIHMQLGRRYQVDRTIPHWAVNDGETDRVHLLLEY